MRISLKDNRRIFICSSISIALVIVSYVASQWYYSRWDVAPFVFVENDESNIQRIQSFNDVYIGADDPSGRSSKIVMNIQTFEALIYDHPFVQYDEYDEKELRRRFNKATGDRKTEIAWEIIDQFDDAHDFMIRLMELYGDNKLPFEKGSEPYLFIEKMINSYTQFVEAVDDPFMAQAFQDLEQRITEAQQQRESDPEWIKQDNAYKRVIKLVEQIESEINSPDYEFDNMSTNTPWVMSKEDQRHSVIDDDEKAESSAVFDDLLSSTEANIVDIQDDKTRKHMPSDNESLMEIDTHQNTPLSPEQLDNALKLIDQYGTEEGLRRLRESDPEAAEQFESVPKPGQERRPSEPARDTSDDAAPTQ